MDQEDNKGSPMTNPAMTSMQRVLTTLGHIEPDRVPFFLLLTMHGAKELGVNIKEYYSRAENVVEGQIRLRKKYRHDCYYPFFYAGVEVEAWGCEILYSEDGPPNSGEPIIRRSEDIDKLQAPAIIGNPPLQKVLTAIQQLKARSGDDAPIIGVVMSPFSLPVMQMGFDHYIELMVEQPERFMQLMAVNEAFCADWANAQLAAGATAICYFDPVSSCSIVDPETYKRTGNLVARRTIAQIKGPTATHFASGRCLPIIDAVAETGTAIIGISVDEDPAVIKAKCAGRLSILGNLNGIEMRHWTPEQAEAKVKDLFQKVAPGGGFILSDNHGEIPFQVPDEILLAISEAVLRWGKYPIQCK
jgi:uroporphyrinogen decarboxylase